ncbi:MAG: ubiquinol-cytochrome c reductase iron-sulfur subunit [Candidatus Omnitrophica bacterium]|nr:ubiquinol-cytochrome c reductase iron-sulfur subunit [Candidatus Omnitrophota bacterium]MCA9415664.1 ubiquinol-cytochrome c reductase iron-sulfur subunit [Candidatus Omnitrophota bacterium]MCA9425616.1 ubiquinol-cytochrome c reductase iron-sulfur subunit [Candidatus Omnitrophota bacterium]MCA9429011.1 ubiquinol-cytochrome c reductase iron-sulfur subunit [Candidatus Omnitrophota bacterium]MCA9436805.1 ubiquinol-cytochrome c reductase iron-sulfur subunit [Candidatus Omnitrophota bacterium]
MLALIIRISLNPVTRSSILGYNRRMQRRSFFQSFVAFVGSIVLAAVGLGTAIVQGVGSVLHGKGKDENWIKVDEIDHLLPGQPQERTISFRTKDGWEEKTEHQKVLIIYKDGEPVAHSPSCPHLDCPVSLVPEAEKFICKCHMSYFDAKGDVIEGPAPRGLDPLPTKIEDGVLYCRWVRYQSGGSQAVEV